MLVRNKSSYFLLIESIYAIPIAENVAHDIIKREANDIGLQHRTDKVGNLYLTLPGYNRHSPVIMTGSHLDSVPHGGNFDGAAGVLAGLVMLEMLSDEPQSYCDVTMMVIRAEEMIWFPEHYLGSRAAFGLLSPEAPDLLKRSDTMRSLSHHMLEAGFDPQAIRNREVQLKKNNIRSFVEVHIEQGPILIDSNLPVGIVTGIRGNLRHRFARIDGQTTHAGGVPRKKRRDAVLAGAELVVRLEDLWLQNEIAGKDLVLTIGEFTTDPTQHGITKVPGTLLFTIDIRSKSDKVLDYFEEKMLCVANQISVTRNVIIDFGPQTRAAPAQMCPTIQDGLNSAADLLEIPTRAIASGGGHDCAIFASQGVPTGMIFIRNENGSHNPDESMNFEDFVCAAEILTEWTKRELRIVASEVAQRFT